MRPAARALALLLLGLASPARALCTDQAEITAWIDGDTFEATVDLGFRVLTRQRFRLMGYNAPELTGPEAPFGRQALDVVRRLLPAGSRVPLYADRDDSFGRWLAHVWLDAEPRQPLVPWLIEHGWGVAWDGSGKRPRPWLEPGARYPMRGPDG